MEGDAVAKKDPSSSQEISDSEKHEAKRETIAQDFSMDHNPEPPSGLGKELLDADNIGNTVFSKHWLFTTLMNLIHAVDSEVESKEEKRTDADLGLDLEDSLQDELCKLWDMSMNQEVVKFLQEFQAIDILTGVIAKSKAPRATEICVGILGNMACSQEACHSMAQKQQLRELIILLLDTLDSPTLVEAMRLLHTVISSVTAAAPWVETIKAHSSVPTSIIFILKSSTNGDLLHNTTELVDKLLDMDEGICEQWSSPDLVQGVLEAAKQTHTGGSNITESLLHVLQLVSTNQPGVQALCSHAEGVVKLCLEFLIKTCSEEIDIITGHENMIGSACSVLAVIFPSWENRLGFLHDDIQLIRCVLKLHHTVYPQLHKQRHQAQHHHHHHHRHEHRSSRNRSTSESHDHHHQHHHHHRHSTDQRPDHHLSRSISLASSQSTDDCAGRRRSNSIGDPTVQLVANDAADKLEACRRTSSQSDETDEKTDEKTDTKTDEKTDEGQDEARVEDSGNSREVLEMVLEVLQGLLVDLVKSLSELELPCPKANSAEGNEDGKSNDNEGGGKSHQHKALEYLETMCERERIEYMVSSLEGAETSSDFSHVELLLRIAEKHNLPRLGNIVRDCSDT